jgi:hypothetical protein
MDNYRAAHDGSDSQAIVFCQNVLACSLLSPHTESYVIHSSAHATIRPDEAVCGLAVTATPKA